MAASGGLMFGYDVGISGGVTSMPHFQKKFFPAVYRKTQEPGLESNYCKYENQGLQVFTSSLYLAALISTFIASNTFSCLSLGGSCLVVELVLLTRQFRFSFRKLHQQEVEGHLTSSSNSINITIGILFANLINYGTNKITGGYGWRVSLGLAGIPAGLLTLGSLVVVDTPNSLIERGKLEEGKAVLKRIRGVDNVDPEFLEIVEASRVAKEVKNPFQNLLKRRNRPQLVIAVMMQVFQQFTGINAVMFYAPVLFQTFGFKSDASLYSAVITGAVNVLSTVVLIYFVDKAGRRVLLLEAGVQMFLSQLVVAIVMGLRVQDNSNNLTPGLAILVVVMVSSFVSSFAWFWGPLGWLIPSETFPLEARSAGQSVAVCINMFFTFIIAQAFLSMLCHMKFGIFLFFTAWVLVMTTFAMFLIHETKHVPIEEMIERVWKQHWFWKRFMGDFEDDRKAYA
ncbi:hypothetical protein ACFX2J_012455 [Malus domestica]